MYCRVVFYMCIDVYLDKRTFFCVFSEYWIPIPYRDSSYTNRLIRNILLNMTLHKTSNAALATGFSEQQGAFCFSLIFQALQKYHVVRESESEPR